MFSALLAVCVLASSALPSAVVVPLQEDRLIVNVLKDAFVRHINSSVIDPRGYRYSRCADFNLATLQLGGNPVFTTDAELDACVFKLAFYTLLFVCLCLSVSVHVRLSVCLVCVYRKWRHFWLEYGGRNNSFLYCNSTSYVAFYCNSTS